MSVSELFSDDFVAQMTSEQQRAALHRGDISIDQLRRSMRLGQPQHSVLQPWVMAMGWKMQSILLSGFRGPDDAELPATKAVNRWIRTISQNNADPSKDYMRQDKLPTDLELCEELEWRSCHYVHHLADSLRVVAIFHPNLGERTKAFIYHHRIAEEIFHFEIEVDEIFLKRHEDKV
jgi:hypothetical protein